MKNVSDSSKLPLVGTRFWSKTGAVVIEIDATLLTGSDRGECRVSGEHFWQPYVGSRCEVGAAFAPNRA